MLYGARVAVDSLYKAILKCGTFDEYHLFFNSPTVARRFKKNLSALDVDEKRIRLIKIDELVPYLQKTRYTVFFVNDISVLSELSYLRARFAKANFPICSMAHSVCYGWMLKESFLDNLVSDTRPFDSIICTSRAQLKAMRSLNRLVGGYSRRMAGLNVRYRGRLDLLPLGVDAGSYGRRSKISARKGLRLPRNKKIILYFGRFSIFDKMDLHPVLIAFRELARKDKNLLLLFAGRDEQGRYGRKIKRMARGMGLSSRTRFFLNPSLKNKYLLYAASDIFLSPSDNIQESFGLTILEAMAAGLPVVASDWNGYRDIVLHGKTGFLAPTYWTDCDGAISYLSRLKACVFGDWMQDLLYLAQALSVDARETVRRLSLLIKDERLRLELGRNGRARVLKKYDWKVLMPEYERLWKKLSALSERYRAPESGREMLIPRYFKCFRHYPTRILAGGDKVAISDNGTEYLKDKKDLGCPDSLRDLLSMSVIFEMLSSLAAKKASTVSAAEEGAKKVFKKRSLDNLRYHIMWLLKKDLIRVV